MLPRVVACARGNTLRPSAHGRPRSGHPSTQAEARRIPSLRSQPQARVTGRSAQLSQVNRVTGRRRIAAPEVGGSTRQWCRSAEGHSVLREADESDEFVSIEDDEAAVQACGRAARVPPTPAFPWQRPPPRCRRIRGRPLGVQRLPGIAVTAPQKRLPSTRSSICTLACSRAARAFATVTSTGRVFGRRSITSETAGSELVLDTERILVALRNVKAISATASVSWFHPSFAHAGRSGVPRRLHTGYEIDWSQDGTELAFDDLVKAETKSGLATAVFIMRDDGTRTRQLAKAATQPGVRKQRLRKTLRVLNQLLHREPRRDVGSSVGTSSVNRSGHALTRGLEHAVHTSR